MNRRNFLSRNSDFQPNFRNVLGAKLVVRKDSFKNAKQTESVSIDMEQISWDDKTCLKSKNFLCWLLSPDLDSTDLSLHFLKKKKKWERFRIKGNEESRKNLVRGTQVPFARATMIHESPWRYDPFSPHESRDTTRHNNCTVCTLCTTCTSCTFLCYSGRIWALSGDQSPGHQ